MNTTTEVTKSKKALPFRIELIRQVKRKRTLVAFILLIALPLIVVTAVKFGPSSNDSGGGFGGGDLDLVGLATSGGWNFALTMMFFASGFLLLILVAMFTGDTVASEASWSTLRYLLIAPVPRRRLLTIKLAVVVAVVFRVDRGPWLGSPTSLESSLLVAGISPPQQRVSSVTPKPSGACQLFRSTYLSPCYLPPASHF